MHFIQIFLPCFLLGGFLFCGDAAGFCVGGFAGFRFGFCSASKVPAAERTARKECQHDHGGDPFPCAAAFAGRNFFRLGNFRPTQCGGEVGTGVEAVRQIFAHGAVKRFLC